MKTSKGFTIIELLVVIAIIAVLAAVVMVNVTGYIAKGRDAAVKANLASAQTDAAVYFDNNATSHGSDFAGGTQVANIEAQITAAKGTPAHAGSGATQDWCVCSTLVTNSATVTCVDGTGAKVDKTSTCAVECPTTGTAIGICVP